MKRFFSVFLIALTSVGLLTSCKPTAQDKADYIVKKVTNKLDLDDQQEAKLKKVADKALVLKKQNQDQRDQFHAEIKNLILAENVKEEDIRALMDKKRQQIDDVLPQILPEVLDFHQSLKPEQKQKAVEFMEKFKKRHRKRWQ
jgi:Spy/CpxP family protein refolding chaperone